MRTQGESGRKGAERAWLSMFMFSVDFSVNFSMDFSVDRAHFGAARRYFIVKRVFLSAEGVCLGPGGSALQTEAETFGTTPAFFGLVFQAFDSGQPEVGRILVFNKGDTEADAVGGQLVPAPGVFLGGINVGIAEKDHHIPYRM